MKEVIKINENTWRIEDDEPVNVFGNEVTLYKFDYAGFLCQ